MDRQQDEDEAPHESSWEENLGSTQETRAPLNRTAVLDAAVAMADEHGLGSISMRKLGEELGVEAMSLYNHVANKEDLLDGMVDRVFAELGTPDPGEPWREALGRCAHTTREALGRHRWAIAIMDSRSSPGPATMRRQDSIIGLLRANGFSLSLTAHTIAAFDAYVYGFAMQEAALPFDTHAEVTELAATLLEQMGAAYPHFAEFAVGHVLKPGYDFGEEFDFGLELVLEGVERRLVDSTE